MGIVRLRASWFVVFVAGLALLAVVWFWATIIGSNRQVSAWRALYLVEVSRGTDRLGTGFFVGDSEFVTAAHVCPCVAGGATTCTLGARVRKSATDYFGTVKVATCRLNCNFSGGGSYAHDLMRCSLADFSASEKLTRCRRWAPGSTLTAMGLGCRSWLPFVSSWDLATLGWVNIDRVEDPLLELSAYDSSLATQFCEGDSGGPVLSGKWDGAGSPPCAVAVISCGQGTNEACSSTGGKANLLTALP